MVSKREVFFVYGSLRPSCLRVFVRRHIQYGINWAALGLSLRHICMLINSKAWGPQAVWNVIKYAINDREIERPSIKDKRPHFLFEHRLLLLSVPIFLPKDIPCKARSNRLLACDYFVQPEESVYQVCEQIMLFET